MKFGQSNSIGDIQNGIPEAPIDDKIYGRKNAEWEEIISGDSGIPLTKTSETTITIEPNNTTWITGTPSSVALTLGTPLADYESEYRLTFIAGESASLTVNAPTDFTVVYPDGVPTFESGKLYEFSFMAININTISCLWKVVEVSTPPHQ